MSNNDSISDRRQEIVAWFSTTAGLITGGVVVVALVVAFVVGAIFGWFA